MNISERKNYLIAILVSLLVHFFLGMLHSPRIPAPEKPDYEVYSFGLMEFASDIPRQPLTVALNVPVVKSRSHQEKAEIKSAEPAPPPKEAPKEVAKEAAPLPETERAEAFDAPAAESEVQSVSGAEIEEMTGFENLPDEQRSFGTGEAMVKIVGPMPTYPPAAFREGKEGTVTVRVLVNAAGQVDLVIVTKSSGDLRLDYAATSSVEREWKFTSLNEGYYIDLLFSFDLQIGTSVRFITSKTRF